MSTDQFCYWLQGFNELVGKNPTEEQWRIIQDHLNLVFNKVTPNYTPNYTPVNKTYCYSGKKCNNLSDLNLLETYNQLITC